MKHWIEGVALFIMVVGVIGIFVERGHTGRGIGVRIIQFATVVLVFPIILILALEDILEPQTVGALVGAVIGYVLSGIGKDEPNTNKRESR